MVSEEMSRELGGSVPIANVQALASSCSGNIPLRYLRPEFQSEEVLVDDTLQIPTIDMRKLMVDDDDDDEMGKLHSACKEWGIIISICFIRCILSWDFYQIPLLINHDGVAEEVMEKMKADVQEFFKLPQKEKNAYAKQPTGVDGYGQNFVLSEEQKLNWADDLFLQTLPKPERKMRFWPQQPTSFRETLDKYSLELVNVSKCLLKLMAKNLAINPEQFANMFEDGRLSLRMNYYPPCEQASKVLGLTPHSDFGGLTLLVQVNEVQGLQIKRNGKWIPIRPLPGAFIINIGDVIEILSNGEYKSIEHRAVVDPEKERLSIAAFYTPCDGTIIGPLPELTKKNGPKYKSVSREEYIKYVLTRKPDGKSSVNLMKLES